MLSRVVLAGVLLFAAVPARADQDAVLTIKVDHIAPKGGNLRLAIYDAKSFADDDANPVADKVIAATPSVQTVIMPGIAPGTYAVKMFQDVNRNEKFDFNWLGIPSERYGFSNNAKPNWIRMSAPTFEEAKILLKAGANWTEIWLH
ncbi:MAG TPA: DUF2141 domain-containing protein [Rhizomicrobium sp.]|nr:DUF2141 domain-containing protein [Rhizomicrobium sp.]